MKTEQEQIEEIAKERNEIKDIMNLLDKCVSLNPMCKAEVATVVYGNNYRKITEGSVVFSKEDYNDYLNEAGYRKASDVIDEFVERLLLEVNPFCFSLIGREIKSIIITLASEMRQEVEK